MTDSRTAIITILDRSVYSTSASDTNDDIWIQAPIAAQQFESSEPLLISGIYAKSRTFDPLDYAGLLREFAAWEAASDEALMNFEKGLD